jgi:hypothetical protein
MPRDRIKSGCAASSRGAYPFFGNRLKRGHGFAISVAGPPAPPAGSASRKDHAASSAEAEELNDKPRDTPFLPAALVERFDDLSDRIAISPCNRDETHHQPKKAGSWRVSCYMSGIPVLTVPSGFFLFLSGSKAARVRAETGSAPARADPNVRGRRLLHRCSERSRAALHRVTALAARRHREG